MGFPTAGLGLEPLLLGTGWEYRGCAPGKGKAEGGDLSSGDGYLMGRGWSVMLGDGQ